MWNRQVTDTQPTVVHSVQCETDRSLTLTKLLFLLCNVKQTGHWRSGNCCSFCKMWNRQVTHHQQTTVHCVQCETDRTLTLSKLLFILCNVKQTGHGHSANCCSFCAMLSKQVTDTQQTAVHSVQFETDSSLTPRKLLFIVCNVKQTGHWHSANCCSFCALWNRQVTDTQQTAVHSVQCEKDRSLTPSKLLFILFNVKQTGNWRSANCCSFCAMWNRQVTDTQQTAVHSVHFETDRSLTPSRRLFILCIVKQKGHWHLANCCSFCAMWNRQVSDTQQTAVHCMQWETERSLTLRNLQFILCNVKQTGHLPSANCCTRCAMWNRQVTDPQETVVHPVQCETGHWPSANCCSLCAMWNREVTDTQETVVHSVQCETDRSLTISKLLFIVCNVKQSGHWHSAYCCSFSAIWNWKVTDTQQIAVHSMQCETNRSLTLSKLLFILCNVKQTGYWASGNCCSFCAMWNRQVTDPQQTSVLSVQCETDSSLTLSKLPFILSNMK